MRVSFKLQLNTHVRIGTVVKVNNCRGLRRSASSHRSNGHDSTVWSDIRLPKELVFVIILSVLAVFVSFPIGATFLQLVIKMHEEMLVAIHSSKYCCE